MFGRLDDLRYQKLFRSLIIQLFLVREFVFPARNKRYKSCYCTHLLAHLSYSFRFDGFRSINIYDETI